MRRSKHRPRRHTPQLKCNKGEFAMVTGSDTGWAGVIVEIIGLMHDIYPDHFHRSIKDVWVVAHAEDTYLCRDCDLMPIRGDALNDDETDPADGINQ